MIAGLMKRQSNVSIGQTGERIARALLERSGFTIVDANVRFALPEGVRGELDIVAWDGATLCFVEVKTRRGTPGRVAPGEAVTLAKQKQIARLATVYAAQNGLLEGEADIAFRFDVVCVYLGKNDNEGNPISHTELLRGAFEALPDAE
jgi:putative endonuclease